MKVGRDYSWWVDYSFTYEYWDDVDYDEWIPMEDYDSGRFNCRKVFLKKEVKKFVKDYVLANVDFRKLKVKINDCYMTTTTEV